MKIDMVCQQCFDDYLLCGQKSDGSVVYPASGESAVRSFAPDEKPVLVCRSCGATEQVPDDVKITLVGV